MFQCSRFLGNNQLSREWNQVFGLASYDGFQCIWMQDHSIPATPLVYCPPDSSLLLPSGQPCPGPHHDPLPPLLGLDITSECHSIATPPTLTQRMDAWGCGAENTGITGAQKSNPHLSVYHNLIRVSDVALATEHSHIQIRTFLFSLGGTLANVWSQRHLSGAIGWGARFLLSDNGWLPQLKANRKLVLRVLVINSQLYSFV